MISHIILELAREPGHPHGDRSHGYHLYLPLDADGRIDGSGWRKHRARFQVRKFLAGKEEQRGQIVHGPGGSWVFDYDGSSHLDDEQGFRLKEERFVPGEYVSIREADGAMHTFQVVSVRPQ